MDRVSVLTVKNKIILFFSKVRIAKGAILLGKIRIYNYGKIFIGNSFSLVLFDLLFDNHHMVTMIIWVKVLV